MEESITEDLDSNASGCIIYPALSQIGKKN